MCFCLDQIAVRLFENSRRRMNMAGNDQSSVRIQVKKAHTS
jgi:hypothetical protein